MNGYEINNKRISLENFVNYVFNIMTREELIKLAKEKGINFVDMGGVGEYSPSQEDLTRYIIIREIQKTLFVPLEQRDKKKRDTA